LLNELTEVVSILIDYIRKCEQRQLNAMNQWCLWFIWR